MLGSACFGPLVHHDDAEREYANDAGAQRVLDPATPRGLTVMSVENDFASAF